MRQGRFTQPDPLGMGAASLADPQSLNMYSYVGNDPINRVDPDGQFWGALFKFIGGLFRNLKPNVINGSFAYGNHPPVSVSFAGTGNIYAEYAGIGITLRSGGLWLPELLNPKDDPFGDALAAARGILQGDNDCSKFFKGAGLDALNSIADAVKTAGDKAYGRLDVAMWLTAPDEVSCAYRSLLSPEETARADKFAFEHLKRHHEVSQGGLRLLLARYLRCRPCDLAFTFGPKGKPVQRGDSHVQFNLSNSGELVVYAFAIDCELGVDVEQVRRMTDLKQIVSRYFCEAEASELMSINGGQARQEAFYRCWTRKEAYIKAIGSGLTLPLDQFQVTLLPDDAPRFVHIGENAKAAKEWTLQHFNPAPGYIGALAYHAAARNIVFHKLQAPQKLLDQIG